VAPSANRKQPANGRFFTARTRHRQKRRTVISTGTAIPLHFTPHHFTITAKLQRYMPWPSNFSPTRKHTSDSNSLAYHDGNSESFHRENYEQRYSDSDAGAH
jgi:hypothetical protein